MNAKKILTSTIVLLSLSLVGCETISKTTSNWGNSITSTNKGKAQSFRATGYAPISLQPGKTQQQKVINAIRASKLRAYQELTAIIHGQYVSSSSTVKDMVIVNDDFKTAVAGIVRGARVVKSYPVQNDIYATILEVSGDQLQQAWIINNN